MDIDCLAVGPLQTNCYVISDEKTLDAMVVDPGDEADKILRLIGRKGLKVGMIVCTHGHFDHVGAVSRVKGETRARVALNRDDIDIYNRAQDQAAFWEFTIEPPPEPDLFLADQDRVTVGRLNFEVLSTPGHSPGGICLYGEGVIVSGDTIFAGSVGRTDFYGGNMDELKKSFLEILSLPPETRILPGHGEPSTVGTEKETNFFLDEL
ncbi:MAG: MBL fold metallo-hydrolase [Candidatus Sulfobium sp.]|jgi:hydroxyacylglutathione hydrolase